MINNCIRKYVREYLLNALELTNMPRGHNKYFGTFDLGQDTVFSFFFKYQQPKKNVKF